MKSKLSILIACLFGFNLSPLNSNASESITERVERLQSIVNSLEQTGPNQLTIQTKTNNRLSYWNNWRDWKDWPNWKDYWRNH